MATKTSSSCSSSSWKRYDVFLSFRGEDTRNGFTDHLYKALNDDKGIYTFRDDKKLERGKDVAPELLKAIEVSRFAIVVFSKDYASSTWCLIELAKIVECKKNLGLTVLPVFYHVEPTDVRKQKGEFGEAFAKHVPASQDDIEEVNKWREALTEVASISGWHIKEKEGRPETEDLKEILQVVLKESNKVSICNNDLVGMASRIRKLYLVLKISRLEEISQLKDVCTVGIWGMGGIGKTTLAEEVKTNISNEFEACGFVANVREEFGKNGIVHLQNRLYKFLLDEEGKIQNVEMGKNVLRNRLCSRRVLIILDDVDELEQIEDLVGNAEEQHKWLGPGSRVIVTTRNKDLLKTYGENNIYEVDELNEDEALHFFSRKAFRKHHPLDGFVDLSKNFVKYADGHPFAIKVLGSFLYGRKMDEWSETLKKLIKGNPEETIIKVFRVLQVSYNGLDGDKKKIFLDIACFFKGWDAHRVKKILDGCGLHPTIDIEVLIEKSLITLVGDKFWMHDLLQQMGQDIVRQESPEEPGERSRIWFHEDACDVFVNNTGTKAVQGIFLSLPRTKEPPLLKADSILNMEKLRLLKFQNVHFPKLVEYLSNELRLLEWHEYPLTSMPPNFHPNKLVELNMPSSRIERLWKQIAHDLEWLISINLSNCENLKQAPDFSRIPNLEMLILEGCTRLSKVDPAIGELKRLVILNLKGCKSLKSLSQSINLESLKTFILSGCTKLNKFPEIVGKMDNLSQLYLDGTTIEELPMSIEHLSGLILLDLKDCKNLLKLPDVLCSLTSLTSLDISGCSHLNQLPEDIGSLVQLEKLDASRTAIRKAPSSILLLKDLKTLCFAECSSVGDRSLQSLLWSFSGTTEEATSFQLPNSFFGLSSLTSLNLSKCNLSEGAIPEDIGCLSSLEHLDLGENDFMSLPESISQLSNLKILRLVNCSKLQSLPKLPSSIKYAYTHDCPMLKLNYSNDDQITVWTSDKGFSLIDSRKPGEVNGKFHDIPMPEEHMDTLFPKYIEDQIYHGGKLILRFACKSIPGWCSEWSNGSSITIQLPLKDGSKTWIGFALFVVFLIREHDSFDEDWVLKETICHFYTDKGCLGHQNALKGFKNSSIGSHGLCIYVPRMRFAQQLSKATQITASVSTSRPDLEIKMCGIHVIFNEEVPKFSRNLAQTFSEHLNFAPDQHYKQILEEASKLKKPCDVIELQSNPRKLQDRGSSSTIEGFKSSKSDSTNQLRRDIGSLVSIIIQGCYALDSLFAFNFPLKAIATRFFHQSVGSIVVCYLPKNLFDEKGWLGFCLYAAVTWRPISVSANNDMNSQVRPCLFVDLHTHGSSTSFIGRIPVRFNNVNSHQIIFFDAPRVHFGEELNQCWGVSALFTTNIPTEVEVNVCGIRLACEKDLEDLVGMITASTLSCPDELHQSYYQEYKKVADGLPGEIKFGEPKMRNEKRPIQVSDSLKREYKHLQKFLLSAQQVDEQVSTAYQQLSVPSDPIVLHSVPWNSESSYQLLIVKGTSIDSTVGHLIHLQIMAETLLYVDDPIRWKKCLENCLRDLFWFDVIVTLSINGRIVTVMKPFDPFSTYNLCFPQKEILKWFKFQATARKIAIRLPPNLNTDNNWKGLVVCASFAVQEHPTSFLDNKSSETSFRLLCHLETERYCLNPVSVFRVTKEKFMWLYVRNFIWLTYIPSFLLHTESNENRLMTVSIYCEFPGVVTYNLAARLLYQQDVNEFRYSMMQCMTSFFDNGEPISKFMADENVNSSHAAGKTDINEDVDSYVVTQHEKNGMDFDKDIIFNLCFPPTEILEWFSHHSSGPFVTIQLPLDLYGDTNWTGLALCAYFSEIENQTTFLDYLDQETSHFLYCRVESGRAAIETLHHYRMTDDEFERLDKEFMWLSYIPRLGLTEKLNGCRFIEASFASGRGGLWARKCGLRLLYQHNEEEFKQAINYCMTSLLHDNRDSISDIKVDNDGHDTGSRNSGSSAPQSSNRKHGRKHQSQEKDKGKQVLK